MKLEKIVSLMEARGVSQARIKKYVMGYVAKRYPEPSNVTDVFDIQQIMHHERGFEPFVTFGGAA